MQNGHFGRARSVLACGLSLATTLVPGFVNAGDWTITPRVVGQDSFTDNALFTSTNRRADLITTVAPGINVTGESARVQATLDYSPTLQLYAFTPGQNFIDHNLYANGTAA